MIFLPLHPAGVAEEAHYAAGAMGRFAALHRYLKSQFVFHVDREVSIWAMGIPKYLPGFKEMNDCRGALPSRERVRKSLSHPFLTISIQFIKAERNPRMWCDRNPPCLCLALVPMSSSLHIGGFRKASQRAVEEAVFAADVGPLAKLAREKITKNHD